MTTKQKPLLVMVVGPTGSGKTDMSITLARHYGAPVVSADSRQFYRGMSIGTAQPSADQLAVAQHHFISERDVTQDFNCGDYEAEALKVLDELMVQSRVVIGVGGSGLYVDALCGGLDDLPGADPILRTQLQNRLQSEGLDALTEQLRRLDPEYYEKVDRKNPQRVIRALEVCISTGEPYSAQRRGRKSERDFAIIKIGVDIERAELYDRINRRVDIMIADGLVEEARKLYPLRHLNALQTVGYRELFHYFDGDSTLEQAIEMIKQNSRRYAKRQMTWFRRDESILWFRRDQVDEIIACIDEVMQ